MVSVVYSNVGLLKSQINDSPGQFRSARARSKQKFRIRYSDLTSRWPFSLRTVADWPTGKPGDFPVGPCFRNFFGPPAVHACKFISLIISWNSRQTGSAFTEPVERPPYLPVGGPHVCSGASCYVCEKFSGRVQMYDGCCSVRWWVKKGRQKIKSQLL